MDGAAADVPVPAATAAPVDMLLSMLNAAFSQFLSPEIVGKTILAAGRAAGIDDATLKAKLYAMGAVVKDEQQQQKGAKVKKPKGEGKGKGMSLYTLFITKHCAETRAEDAKHPLAPGEKRDGNRLKDAISAWADLDKGKFEELYGDLVRDLKERQQKGEKIDVSAEVTKFEQTRGMSAATVAKARRLPEEPAGAKPAKKAKLEAAEEEEEEDGSSSSGEHGNGAANGDKAASSSGESEDSESEESEDEEPVPKATPSKGKKPAAGKPAAPAAPAAKAGKAKAEPGKAKTEEGKKKDKKEKKAEKKK